MTITRCKIHPAIGVARVGDSPSEFFIGPERPGRTAVPDGGYKDPGGYVKRQAARFRIFGYDDGGNAVRELTDADAEIRWTVHLANRKAAAPLFDPPQSAVAGLRNEKVPEAHRGGLVIDPGARTISGRDVHGAAHRFDTGTFQGVAVELGELRTDEAGRLVVLGGRGRSESPSNEPLLHFADNSGWFDDTSDGPVTAEVVLRDGDVQLRVEPSWVVVAPPDFAPSIGNVVTLHDIAEQAALERKWLSPPEEVSFWHDIHPLLVRVAGYQWVDAAAFRGHRRGDRGADETTIERQGDFLDPALLKLLADPSGGDAARARQRVFAHVRRPRTPEEQEEEQAKAQATAAFMPQLSGDGGYRREGEPSTWLTVTPLQYRRLELWASGAFSAEAADQVSAGTRPPDDGRTEPTPDELDRAALENCVGGGFYPGIEVTDRTKKRGLYTEMYRLDHKQLEPGSITERMAVPWQADFADCRGFWWPAQRPDHVIVDGDYESVARGSYPSAGPGPWIDTLAFPRHRWDRGIGDRPPVPATSTDIKDRRHRDMVDKWSKLGFVVPRTAPDGRTVWTETERDRYVGLRDRDYFHIMLNLDRYPDFLPTANELAKSFIAAAHGAQENDPDLDGDLRYFDYDDLAFDTRLDSIYHYLADAVEAYDPANDGTSRTRADVVERIRQFAPLNQTDGAWLRNVATIGPIDEVTGLLTRIWIDEIGGGDPVHNHANIYTALLGSVGIDPAPVTSIEYAQDPALLDSAFTVPLLQLVVSQFTEQFLPEILGMTLHFEWESVELARNVRLCEAHGIDPTFYGVHLTIDNVAAGHGALAKQAVKRYLANFHGGDRQRQWARIWDGYVAFRDTGTLFEDLKKKLRSSPEDRVVGMIEQKKRYGNLNHGGVPAATGMNNNLFDDPRHMLTTLVERGLVVPGRPDQSRFLQLFEIDGAMYRVFTPDEQQLWKEWIVFLGSGEARSRTAGLADTSAVAAQPGSGDRAARDGERRHVKRLFLSSPAEAFRGDPPPKLRGRGAVQ